MALPTQTVLNGISLCSGVGGLELGIELVLGDRYRCRVNVEREVHAAIVLATRMEDGLLPEAAIWTDLATFDGKPWRGILSFLSGGIPCQPASCVGKRKGTDDERWLWPHAIRIVREIRPRYVFFENVSGLLSGRLLDAFREGIIGPLEEMGYRTACGLFTAAEVGASHKRERVFVLAHARDNGCGEKLAHADSGRPGAGGATACGRQSESAPGGEQLADSLRTGWPQYGIRIPAGEENSAPEYGGCSMDDTRGSVSRGETGSRDCSVLGRPSRVTGSLSGEVQSPPLPVPGFGLTLFPPGPDDLDSWREILRLRPDLAPALECSDEQMRTLRRQFGLPVTEPSQPPPGEAQPERSEGEQAGGAERRRTGERSSLAHAECPGRNRLHVRLQPGHLASDPGGESLGSKTSPAREETVQGSQQEEALSLVHLLVDGVAESMANRVNQLRAAGNGVCPLQAGYALAVLSLALGISEELGIQS